MTDAPDPRIEAIAKMLFTGPLWGYNAETWDLAGDTRNSYDLAYERSRCFMAAEDVLRGIDEAAAKDMLAKNRAAVSYELSVEDYYQRHVRGQKAPE